MTLKIIGGAVAALVLASCAGTTVTDVSRTQFVLSTQAAPACGRVGAQRVATKMAAVEVLRRGFDRYYIVGANNQNNVSVLRTGPTYSNTTANMTAYGNTAYGTARTTYGGQSTIFMGSNDADLAVVMVEPGSAGYSDALDARRILGPDWAKFVETGIQTCA